MANWTQQLREAYYKLNENNGTPSEEHQWHIDQIKGGLDKVRGMRYPVGYDTPSHAVPTLRGVQASLAAARKAGVPSEHLDPLHQHFTHLVNLLDRPDREKMGIDEESRPPTGKNPR